MKVFVTGGTGFVGSHLVERLLKDGNEVHCLARNPDKVERVFRKRRPHIVEGDLSNLDALMKGMTGMDVVYHVAGLTAARNRAEFHQVNAEATRNVVETARRAAQNLSRLVYVSSLAAVGPAPRGTRLPDDATPKPVTAYGDSKLQGEEVVRKSGLPWTVLRPPAVYGPGDRELFKVFKLLKLGLAPLFGDGLQELSLVHVEDLAGALVAALHERALERTYFACQRDIVTSGELVTIIHRALNPRAKRGPRIIRLPAPVTHLALALTGTAARLAGRRTVLSPDKAAEFLAPAWTCSPEALEHDTGWSARYDTRDGIADTLAWYRNAGWL